MSEYVLAYKSDFVAVADSIRAKTGASESMAFPDGFVEAVEGIQTGGGTAGGGDGSPAVGESVVNIGVSVSITAVDCE